MLRTTTACLLLTLFISTAVGFAQGPVSGQTACYPLEPANPDPAKLTPWFWNPSDGGLFWGRHQFYEDPANTVFMLQKELITLDNQVGTYPEVLYFNFAQFYPMEGIDNGMPRQVMRESVEMMGLQLYVNYSNRTIDPSQGSQKYLSPSFFISIDGHAQNDQTEPPVPWSGFSFQHVSATRGSFGCIKDPVPAHGTGDCDDVYVTAGLGYGLSELDQDFDHQVFAAETERDRLMWRNPATQIWEEISQEPVCPGSAGRLPASAAAGNNSGVAFADFTGDGWADLYVGKAGDSYAGAANVLLINNGTGCFTDQTSTRIPAQPSGATNEVTAFDADQDGDLDLAVANRCQRTTCGIESEDYVLINDGSGNFSVVMLNPGQVTDSRSVAAGDLNQDGWQELVFGNAGSDGFSNQLAPLPPAEDHPMQVFTNGAAVGGQLNTFLGVTNQLIDAGTEIAVTQPLTQQIQLVDMFAPTSSPTPNAPDGWLDLVIVNHRDILKHNGAYGAGSRVWILVNKADYSGPGPYLLPSTAWPSDWVRAVAVADFTGTGYPDVLDGRGNRFDGVQSDLRKNIGPAGPAGNPWDNNGGFINEKSYDSIPGNERGYGFDYADIDHDGALDALQTSRGYNFLVRAIAHPTMEPNHEDLAAPWVGGTGVTSNKRGRLQPKGMEDGVFADFDGDGNLDALLASQRNPSFSFPGNPKTPDSILLVNNGSGYFSYDIVPQGPYINDSRIDLNGRTNHPAIADRAVAADLDGDEDVDAIVNLFELNGTGPVFNPPSTHSFGWRYLENIEGEAGSGSFWLKDVAATKMRNTSGNYDPNWNRGLGMDALADFDNNGRLDLYTGVGWAKLAGEVGNVAQTYDLLFMNGVAGQPHGILTEQSATLLPAPCQDVVKDLSPTEPLHISCGSYGIAQGDIDNDGDADAVITRHSNSGRTNYPWLLINRINEASGAMVDEYTTRVPIQNLSPTIHTPDTDLVGPPGNTVGMDDAMFPTLVDLDGDGDLDLLLQVVNDIIRALRNVGKDSNNDGLINASDNPPPGTFTDATDAWIGAIKPTTDSQDLIGIDLDGDGDYDVANDPFDDMVTHWRNDRYVSPYEPVVTEIWPRVGWPRGGEIELHGATLGQVDRVQFRFAGGATCTATTVTPVLGFAGKRIRVTIPASCPVGLAQVRVRRSFGLRGCTNTITRWSKQYFGYFVLEPAPPFDTVPEGPIPLP